MAQSQPIGVLVIGQTPRPDLTTPLQRRLPAGYHLVAAGALDGLSAADLPATTGRYPLQTRLRDGALVRVEEAFLLPRLGAALVRLEAQAVVATALLCAGTFAGLTGRRPVYKPFAVGQARLQALGFGRIGLLAPIPEQTAPIGRRWRAAGFQPTVWAADLAQLQGARLVDLRRQIEAEAVTCLVLDYVGHPPSQVARLAQNVPVPVFDLGQLTVDALLDNLVNPPPSPETTL